MVSDPLVWIDCEMTGLDINKDRLIEVAVLITDADLNIVAEGPDLVIHQPKDVMDAMDSWCQKHHKKSGLTEAVLSSTISVSDAASEILAFIKRYVPERGVGRIAGNSVYMDKLFLMKEMPEIVDWCHYRLVDVSTVKDLARRWYPDLYGGAPRKRGEHRALSDIKESVDELRYYRSKIFIPQTTAGVQATD